jgi:lysyl-tRNA synthetase class 2
VSLSEDAKSILATLSKNERMPLQELKEAAGLSNKKWDKAVKELTKQNIAKVEKSVDGLWIGVV